jgi:DNA-directed RNA polymerase specialized sigma24 family protein
MSGEGSITCWLEQLKAGDPSAAQPLWEAYFRRLVGLARKKLQAARPRGADEEDVALSAFDSFCRGAADGRFPRLADRDDLWRLLLVLTERKAADLIQRERRLKRGGGRVLDEAALAGTDGSSDGLQQLMGREPNPEFAAEVAEEIRHRLDLLGEGDLRTVALMKLQGYTNAEIAARLDCVLATITRKLHVIRSLWGHDEGTP